MDLADLLAHQLSLARGVQGGPDLPFQVGAFKEDVAGLEAGHRPGAALVVAGRDRGSLRAAEHLEVQVLVVLAEQVRWRHVREPERDRHRLLVRLVPLGDRLGRQLPRLVRARLGPQRIVSDAGDEDALVDRVADAVKHLLNHGRGSDEVLADQDVPVVEPVALVERDTGRHRGVVDQGVDGQRHLAEVLRLLVAFGADDHPRASALALLVEDLLDPHPDGLRQLPLVNGHGDTLASLHLAHDQLDVPVVGGLHRLLVLVALVDGLDLGELPLVLRRGPLNERRRHLVQEARPRRQDVLDQVPGAEGGVSVSQDHLVGVRAGGHQRVVGGHRVAGAEHRPDLRQHLLDLIDQDHAAARLPAAGDRLERGERAGRVRVLDLLARPAGRVVDAESLREVLRQRDEGRHSQD
ncbi:MAG: hypothetical protein ACK559_28190, partial [bacterium]